MLFFVDNNVNLGWKTSPLYLLINKKRQPNDDRNHEDFEQIERRNRRQQKDFAKKNKANEVENKRTDDGNDNVNMPSPDEQHDVEEF